LRTGCFTFEFELLVAGLSLLIGRLFDCFLSVAASGIPGVGVAPFGTGVIFVGSGIPGVGVVPFGTLFALAGSGIPGVVLPEGATGSVLNSGGKFVWLATAAFVFALAFVFGASVAVQAELIAIRASIKINKAFFDIKKLKPRWK
jgi:hypothetical protein